MISGERSSVSCLHPLPCNQCSWVAPVNELRTNQESIQPWAHSLVCCTLPPVLRGQFADDTNAWSFKKTPKTVDSFQFRLLWIILMTIYVPKLTSTCILRVFLPIVINLGSTAYDKLYFILSTALNQLHVVCNLYPYLLYSYEKFWWNLICRTWPAFCPKDSNILYPCLVSGAWIWQVTT
jgi:hypothetical protein